MKLEEYTEDLALDAAFWYVGLTDPEYPIEQLGDLSIELSGKFRALGIAVLLTLGQSDLFCHHLIRSARGREIYLSRLRGAGISTDHHGGSGRFEPLLDAIASGDSALARRIVELSAVDWQVGREYEDDYLYAQILHRFVMAPAGEEELPALLDRFESALQGQPSGRYEVCRALAEADQTKFDESFETLLNEREEQIESEKAAGRLEEPHVIAERRVFVEGLALLKIAESRGLVTEPEYRYCPSLARVPMKRPFPGE